MDNFFNLTLPELENILVTEEVPKVHARNIFASVYRDDQKKISLLPQRIKKLLPTISERIELKIKSINISNYDQSIKFVLQTKENLLFETVLMPEKGRLTICLSSQIGCAQGCVFCYTGKMRLIRNLTASEIIEQIVVAQQWIRNTPSWSQQVEKTMLTPFKPSVTNVVFMGMGEPLDNVNNVIKAIHIMTDTHGLGIAPRKITISTAGHIPGLNMLKEANLKTGLAISLHAHNDSSRNKIMPINKRWNLKILIDWLREYTHKSGRHVLIQYTLIANVNDKKENAEELVKLLDGVDFKLNLIPLNPISPSRLICPNAVSLANFRDILTSLGVRVLIRYSNGQDINAACGQLVQKNIVPYQ